MRRFQWALLITLLLLPAAIARAAGAAPRPNIVVILADDLGFSDLGCMGSEIKTPNLDALAAGGVRFTQFYNTGRCCPTRASLLTGLYPHQTGVGYMTDQEPYSIKTWINDWYHGDLRHDTVTIAEVLKSAGYGTYAVGKWHITNDMAGKTKQNWPLQRGFDRYYGIVPGVANYFEPKGLVRDNEPIHADADPQYKPAHYYLTDAITDHAVRFIDEHVKAKKDQPLFMYVAYTAAHWPLQARPEDIAKYRGVYDAGYGPIREARFKREKELGVINPDWKLSDQAGDWSKQEHKKWEARCMEVFAAQIDRMDQGVGKIVDELKSTGQLDHTLILFLQDNGACAEMIGRRDALSDGKVVMPGPGNTWMAYGQSWANVSNTPLRMYKHFVHEGGISTPLIAHWPAGISRRGALTSEPGHLIDLMATCVELSGAKYPLKVGDLEIQPMEGVSLAPAFKGEPLVRPRMLFWEHEGNRAIRDGQWKLVAKGARGPWELYDMTRDRTEMHDLAASNPAKLHELAAAWDEYAKRTHAIPWPWGKPHEPQ